MSTKKGPFSRCSSCSRKLLFQNGHSLCLFCLGESHSTTHCRHCKEFTKATLKACQQRLKYFLWNQTLSASQPSDMELVPSTSTIRSEVTVVSPPQPSKESTKTASKPKTKAKKQAAGKKASSESSAPSTSEPKWKAQAQKPKTKAKEITLIVPPISASLPSPLLEDSSRDPDSTSDLGTSLPPRQEPPVACLAFVEFLFLSGCVVHHFFFHLIVREGINLVPVLTSHFWADSDV